jgi:hypothetical protein
VPHAIMTISATCNCIELLSNQRTNFSNQKTKSGHLAVFKELSMALFWNSLDVLGTTTRRRRAFSAGDGLRSTRCRLLMMKSYVGSIG